MFRKKMITICNQEEGRLVMEQCESSLLKTTREKNKAIKTKKSQSNHKGKFKMPLQSDIKKETACFFCTHKNAGLWCSRLRVHYWKPLVERTKLLKQKGLKKIIRGNSKCHYKVILRIKQHVSSKKRRAHEEVMPYI